MRWTTALALAGLAAPAWAGVPEIEAGLENFYYRTAETALNRGNLLGLEPNEDRLRAALGLKQSVGSARAVFRGFVETPVAGSGKTTWTARQAYAQYAFGPGLQVRVGKQRIAWGSGFAWNPTNRLEPPKNPANTGLEQEGSLAARLDWAPASWAGVILVAARGRSGLGDLPFEAVAPRRRVAALRARFLVKDTDLAIIFSGGKASHTLVGFDVGRSVFGRLAAHAEAAFHRGSEIAPGRTGETFFRLATGVLYTQGSTLLTAEYFWNGEGDSQAAYDAYVSALERAAGAGALREYAALAAVPFSGGLGLRRQYLQASWTRSEIRGEWTAALRATFGLEDGGIALTPGVGFSPLGAVTLSVDAVVLLGPRASEYRLTPLRGAIQARVKASF